MLALLAGLLGTAPARWPMYQSRPDHNAVFAGKEPAWQWHVDAGGKINGGLAVAGNTLYAETFAPAVIAVDRRNGKVLWRTGMPNIVMTTPIVADGVAIVGTGRDRVAIDRGRDIVWGVPGGDEIVALDARTGRVRWRFKTVGEDMPSPALARVGGRDAVIFANGDDRVRALDVRTGHLLWSTPLLGVSTMASAALKDGLAYVLAGPSAASHLPDHVYAVRVSNGSIAWKAPYGNADCSPVLGRRNVFVEDAQTDTGRAFNDVFALDAPTGRLRWSYESGFGTFTSVGSNEEAIAGMVDRGVLFQSLPAASRFAAFDESTGRVLWSIRTDAAVKTSAIALDGHVYFGDTAGVFYALDEGNGRVAARKQFDKPFTTSSPIVVGRTLYIANWATLWAIPLVPAS